MEYCRSLAVGDLLTVTVACQLSHFQARFLRPGNVGASELSQFTPFRPGPCLPADRAQAQFPCPCPSCHCQLVQVTASVGRRLSGLRVFDSNLKGRSISLTVTAVMAASAGPSVPGCPGQCHWQFTGGARRPGRRQGGPSGLSYRAVTDAVL